MITGWGNYYRHGATRDAFHWADHQIFKAIWQWAKRRHSKKGKRWVTDKYWHVAKGNGWHFTSYFKKAKGKQDSLTLKNLSNILLSNIRKLKEMLIHLILSVINTSIKGKLRKCLLHSKGGIPCFIYGKSKTGNAHYAVCRLTVFCRGM
jgi:hypothetical protein